MSDDSSQPESKNLPPADTFPDPLQGLRDLQRQTCILSIAASMKGGISKSNIDDAAKALAKYGVYALEAIDKAADEFRKKREQRAEEQKR